MDRRPFIIRITNGSPENAWNVLGAHAPSIADSARKAGVENCSIWGIEDLLLCYGETGERGADAISAALLELLGESAVLLCAPGTMRLMYHDIGIVQQDKSLIRHRVFCTHLKPGCEEEYKRRHDGLIEARGDAVSEGPDSNFTIWYGAGYIFGYCEKVRAYDREPTEEEKASTIAWETRQLEIMDWLTDDVDWITGQHHAHIRRIV